MKDTSELRQFLTKMDIDPGYFCKFLKDQCILHFIENNIAVNKSILDIGCDTGYIASILNERTHDFKYVGIDYRNSINSELLNKIKYFTFIQTNNTIKFIGNMPDNSFTDVLLLDVIEHMNDEDEGLLLLTEASKKVRKNGLLFISTPNNRGEINWPEYHKYEYSKDHILQHMDKLPFNIKAIHGWSMNPSVFSENFTPTLPNIPDSINRVLSAWNNPSDSRDILYVYEKNA